MKRSHEEPMPEWKPDGRTRACSTHRGTCEYGLTTWADLFTPRQLVALTTFSDLVAEAMERVERDAANADLPNDERPCAMGVLGDGVCGGGGGVLGVCN